jgi:hypothetical protein
VPEWAAIEQGWSEMLERLANNAAALAAAAPEVPMTTEPCMEHRWLQRLVGDWTFEGEAIMDPQKPGEKFSGTESVRAIGDLWVMAEGKGEMPGDGAASMVMTLGYDPDKGRFVGTFIASMMTYLWRYDGALDTATNTLILDSQGPNMAVPGTMAKFQASKQGRRPPRDAFKDAGRRRPVAPGHGLELPEKALTREPPLAAAASVRALPENVKK